MKNSFVFIIAIFIFFLKTYISTTQTLKDLITIQHLLTTFLTNLIHNQLCNLYFYYQCVNY